MCGFVGFANYKNDISNKKNVLDNMNQTLSKRGPDEEGYYIKDHIALAHKRLIVIDPKGRKTTYDSDLLFWRICYCL